MKHPYRWSSLRMAMPVMDEFEQRRSPQMFGRVPARREFELGPHAAHCVCLTVTQQPLQANGHRWSRLDNAL